MRKSIRELKIEINKAVEVIHNGGVVAFPTETYYGLAVDPFNEDALNRLFALKNRSKSKPLLTLVSDIDQIQSLASRIPSCFLPLMDLWPAPLTLIFPALKTISSILTANTQTVGIRISSNEIATDFVKQCIGPITATSANIAGCAPATCHKNILDSLPEIDFVIRGGDTIGGKSSTLIGQKGNRPYLIREGALHIPNIYK